MKSRMQIASLRPGRLSFIAAMVAVAVSAAGCQSFAPKDMSKLASGGDDKRVAKLAKADPFPSPADVGLEQSPSVK
jgi:hypothetical protein